MPAIESSSDKSIEGANSRLVPPVVPVDAVSMAPEFETGVLFSDPQLTAWWWNTHADLMSNADRHKLAIAAQAQCKSAPCLEMMTAVRDDLESFMAPVSTPEALRRGLANLVHQRPIFSAAIGLALGYFCVIAGMRLFSLTSGF